MYWMPTTFFRFLNQIFHSPFLSSCEWRCTQVFNNRCIRAMWLGTSDKSAASDSDERIAEEIGVKLEGVLQLNPKHILRSKAQ
ncbi:hypothetical protein GDO78_016687 [Eleutherodactylus coqui]|uniref:Uncharacterized protein n=1 Tax=Eleutherodactylus coqui TaxID=57060 RepID=A0A8J6EAB9_ELECQ|nr:hypothetical protein GDO78_016687 [Eleutherodactylus coqui]